jgi:hypothetical protein
MIVKYLKGGSWVYVDNVQRVENSAILPFELVEQFDKEVKESKRQDPVCHTESMDLDTYEKLKDEDFERKAFTMVREETEFDECENNLSADLIKKDFMSCVIVMHIQKPNLSSNEFYTFMLATNQNAYLMNDKGQTIERLI